MNHVIKPHSQALLAMCGESLRGIGGSISAKRAAELTVYECKERHICEACMKELSRVLAATEVMR